jgi:hypothetical protein
MTPSNTPNTPSAPEDPTTELAPEDPTTELAPEQTEPVTETLPAPETAPAAPHAESGTLEMPADPGREAPGAEEPPAPPQAEPAAPPPVWTAASAAPDPRSAQPEPPASRVRVGQLIWAGVLILLGLYLVLLAFLPRIDFGLVLIALVALLGVGLIIAAVATGRRHT